MNLMEMNGKKYWAGGSGGTLTFMEVEEFFKQKLLIV